MDSSTKGNMQGKAQDVVPGTWQPMSSAPAGDTMACIDIWCSEDDMRHTDCFWEPSIKRWCFEVFDADEYLAKSVAAPTHWMPAPSRPGE